MSKENCEKSAERKQTNTSNNAVALRTLSKKEMLKLTEILKSASAEMQKTLLTIDRQQGWLAVGCENFKAYIVQEFSEDEYPSMYDKLKTAKVIAEVAGEEFIGVYSSNSMIPFRSLKPKQRHKVWRELKKECGGKTIPGKWLTRAKVDDIIEKLYPSDDTETETEKNVVKENKQISETKRTRNNEYVSLLSKAKNDKNFPLKVIDFFIETFGSRISQKALNRIQRVLAEQENQNED